jgi:predicted TPR repeat methyltransferase
MSSSTLDALEAALQIVIDLNPKSILDMGVGFGKWGFLCREYLETGRNQVYARKDWKCRIDGIEGFKPYLEDHQRAIYDNLYVRDLDTSEDWLSASHYNLYLAMDVLEHLHNWEGVLNAIPTESHIIAAVPHGVCAQGPVFGNKREAHVVTFFRRDLEPYFDSVEIVKRKLICVRKGVKKQT